MAGIKVYKKIGNLNYRERRYITQLQEALKEKMSDADFSKNFQPASTFEELESLYNKHCIPSVEYTEATGDDTKTEKSELPLEENAVEKEPMNESYKQTKQSANPFDPFNRAEPIVREYVQGDSFAGDSKTSQKSTFSEPTSFNESFKMPDPGNPNEPTPSPGGGGNNNGGGGDGGNQSKTKSVADDPAMSDAKKRRNTKRFAQSIVDIICALAGRGINYFGTKDINDGKLAEMELNGEVDLELLVTLEDDQQATIRTFFKRQCEEVKQLSNITDDEKEDLVDDLTEVFLEKNIGPTPTQQLMLTTAKIFGPRFLAVLEISAVSKSVLQQLKSMKANTEDADSSVVDEQQTPQSQTSDDQPGDDQQNDDQVSEQQNQETEVNQV